MISYILYVCIVLFLTYIGYFLSGKYRLKKNFYKEWVRFHRAFLNDMEYIRRPLPELFERFSAKGEFEKILETYQKEHFLQGNIPFLNKEENGFLSEYFSFLGRSDFTGQKEYFSAAGKSLEDTYAAAEKDAAKYTDLYIKLGFLLGIAIVILLV